MTLNLAVEHPTLNLAEVLERISFHYREREFHNAEINYWRRLADDLNHDLNLRRAAAKPSPRPAKPKAKPRPPEPVPAAEPVTAVAV